MSFSLLLQLSPMVSNAISTAAPMSTELPFLPCLASPGKQLTDWVGLQEQINEINNVSSVDKDDTTQIFNLSSVILNSTQIWILKRDFHTILFLFFTSLPGSKILICLQENWCFTNITALDSESAQMQRGNIYRHTWEIENKMGISNIWAPFSSLYKNKWPKW